MVRKTSGGRRFLLRINRLARFWGGRLLDSPFRRTVTSGHALSSCLPPSVRFPLVPPVHASVSRPRPPVICTWAERVPPCSTGCSPGITGARYSCALRTPTSSALRQRWLKASCRACAGSASTGTKVLTTRPSVWKCIGRVRPSWWPPAMPITVFAPSKSSRGVAPLPPAKAVPPAMKGSVAKFLAKKARGGEPQGSWQRFALRCRSLAAHLSTTPSSVGWSSPTVNSKTSCCCAPTAARLIT